MSLKFEKLKTHRRARWEKEKGWKEEEDQRERVEPRGYKEIESVRRRSQRKKENNTGKERRAICGGGQEDEKENRVMGREEGKPQKEERGEPWTERCDREQASLE